ncbi:flavodoxin family protein [uncultured Muribaculum sp.]|uniref:flavodoxin family protein n=1 Tax=uncultured Muribaculum sp. TaxID=1918613 RepID=UPI0025F2DDF4|nr:flavodoxin family protein [uncultured Muribaculum sp.]
MEKNRKEEPDTVILMASPRRDGRVARAAREVEAMVADAGSRGVVFDLSDMEIRPCRGCMKCRTTGECVYRDDHVCLIADNIRKCDMLVVAAPTYWANMPGTLKVLFDRLVSVLIKDGAPGHMPKPLHKGKRYAIITACSTPWPFNRILGESSGAVAAIRRVFRYSGFKCVDTIQMAGGREVDAGRCARMVKHLMLK